MSTISYNFPMKYMHAAEHNTATRPSAVGVSWRLRIAAQMTTLMPDQDRFIQQSDHVGRPCVRCRDMSCRKIV